MAKRLQPTWLPPKKNTDQPVLKLFNSLTRQKEEFIPENGRLVKWYSCGPTVYDASHMGHARSYISFDILRRVLSDYFGYEVHYVMNITDIDDKIIKRARQNFLYNKYIEENVDLTKVLEDADSIVKMLRETVRASTDDGKKAMIDRMLARVTAGVEELEAAVKAGSVEGIRTAQKLLLQEAKDPLSEWLDKKYGSSITNNVIFADLPRFWEEEFHKDMARLNVLPPNTLTRVSEFVPEIVAYIQKIIENGYAYESAGSVYFDVGKFDEAGNHHYAKLVPEAYGDAKQLEDGEGDLSVSADRLNEKRSPNDFALWKMSKPGEPWWDSPWGKGRPGWHIECSVMASAICGSSMDIHTGGVDLKFPHHDNELAQSEAYFNNNDWVRYFLHSGHLTIAGCKMSKSLKNFITIRDALNKYTARQIRFVFLLHSWKDTLDYSNNTMDLAIATEKYFNEFFLVVKDMARSLSQGSAVEPFQKWGEEEKALNEKYLSTKDTVHASLCDNVDTRSCIDALRELVSASYVYRKEKKEDVDVRLLMDIASYITKIFRIFGAIPTEERIGFPLANAGGDAANVEEILTPYLQILSSFRDSVRVKARELKAFDVLKECDRLRDDILPNVGVRLEDREGKTRDRSRFHEEETGMSTDYSVCVEPPSVVKLVDRETLLKEREAKLLVEEEKRKKKAEAAAAARKAAELKEAQKRIPPKELFVSQTDKYSQFDETGLPTHDAAGNPISKGQQKKLQKLLQAQEKLYQEFLDSQKNSAS